MPALDEVIKKVSERAGVGMGKVAQPIRVAITGNTVSPGIGADRTGPPGAVRARSGTPRRDGV